MQIEIKMTVDNFDELASVLAGLKAQGLEPHTSVTPVKEKVVEEVKPKVAPVQALKPAEAINDSPDFEAFRKSVTNLLAQYGKNNTYFKEFLTSKGYGKLSEVPESARKGFIQDFGRAIKEGIIDDDDLPF